MLTRARRAGPMQIVVLRSYYQNNLQDPGHPNFFCCFLQEYGPTFTPAPNAVTTVPVTLGMVEDPTPAANDGNTVAKGDFLGLAVLSGTTPIPVAGRARATPASTRPRRRRPATRRRRARTRSPAASARTRATCSC